MNGSIQHPWGSSSSRLAKEEICLTAASKIFSAGTRLLSIAIQMMIRELGLQSILAFGLFLQVIH